MALRRRWRRWCASTTSADATREVTERHWTSDRSISPTPISTIWSRFSRLSPHRPRGPRDKSMRNLKAWQKLGLIGLISMVPFAVVTYKMVSSINTLGVEFARQEIRGLEYYTPLAALLNNLQLHRG